MRVEKTRLSALAVVAVAMLGGCQRSPESSLALVPPHRLALWQRPATPERPRRIVAPDVSGWQVDGYRQWRYIVIHHSAGDYGNAAAFDADHRSRGWDELGYHFVIDNGNGGPDGHVEVGSRWRKQKWGAHCGGTPNNEYNNHGIGICLVGDFREKMPTPAQQGALRRLVQYLATRHNIPPEHVVGHCDCPGAHTACPGRFLLRWIRGKFRLHLQTYLARVE